MRNTEIVALLLILWAQDGPAEELRTPAISVRLFDYAGVSEKTMDAGLRETERILKSARVELAWVHCPADPVLLALATPCRSAPGPLTVVLQILPHGATRLQTDPGATGFAVPPAEGAFGAYAGVFHDRVQKLATSMTEAKALGHVIAHELGHLLLGTGQHSVSGIMKADWRYRQVILANQGRLRFDEGERLRILSNIRRRMQALNSGLPESAGRRRD